MAQGEHTREWQQAGEGWEINMQGNVFCRKLGWVAEAAPQTNLEGSEDDTAE